VRDESKIIPRLQAKSVGVKVTLEGTRRAGSEILESCLGRPMSKNLSFRLIKRDELSWHPSYDIVDGSFEISDVKREVECRKIVEKLTVIGIEMMLDR